MFGSKYKNIILTLGKLKKNKLTKKKKKKKTQNQPQRNKSNAVPSAIFTYLNSRLLLTFKQKQKKKCQVWTSHSVLCIISLIFLIWNLSERLMSWIS